MNIQKMGTIKCYKKRNKNEKKCNASLKRIALDVEIPRTGNFLVIFKVVLLSHLKGDCDDVDKETAKNTLRRVCLK